jgi:hypothetical protein
MKPTACGAGVIPRKIRRSASWRTVSDNARQVLIAMARQYNGHNNGQIAFDWQYGVGLGLSALETEIALFELERVGLIASPAHGARQ